MTTAESESASAPNVDDAQGMLASAEAAQPRKPRGFAAMTPATRSAISSKGGKSAQAAGTAHRFTSDEARAAGKKGGAAPHVRRLTARVQPFGRELTMREHHDFRDANGDTFRADPRDILAQLGSWLERRCGGLDGLTSAATSQALGAAIATLTVRRRTGDEEPETERDPAVAG